MLRNWAERYWADLLAVGFFALLFVPYPLTHHFAGNCDTYLGMALADSYVATLREWLGGAASGRSMWPDTPHRLGEATPLVGLAVAAVRATGLSWTWTAYGLMTLIFSANVWALRRCVAALTGDRAVGVVAGFGFAVANTLWAHVDDLIVVFWAIPATVTWLLVRAEERDRPRWLLGAGVLGAAQAYVAIYVYAFQSIWLGAFALGRWRAAPRARRRSLLLAAGLYVGLALPLVFFYAGTRNQVLPVLRDVPWTSIHAATGLTPTDWLTALPDNLMHDAAPIRDAAESPHWVNVRRRVSFGWLWLALALGAFAVRGPPRLALGVTAGFGLLFAVGLPWPPSALLVEVLPWLRYLRVVSRAHLLVLFAATLAVGYLLAHLRQRLPPRWAVGLAVILLVHGLENIPVPLPGSASLPLEAPAPFVEVMAREPVEAVVLHLPADDALVMHGSSQPLFPYNRELLYMLWQPQYRRSTANGLSGYFTPERLQLDAMIKTLPGSEAWTALRQMGITHLAIHPGLALTAREERFAGLVESPALQLVTHTPAVTVWRLAP